MQTLQERLIKNINFDVSTKCWNWTAGKTNGGYGCIRIDGKIKYAHRVSYELFNATSPGSLCVCHRCDNPSCINPDHLYLGTVAHNNADKVVKGRQSKGTKHGSAKLTDEQVIKIRASAETGTTLANRYGVSQAQISDIKNNKRWKHI